MTTNNYSTLYHLYDCTPPSPTPPIDLEATTPTNLPLDHLQNALASQVTPLLDSTAHPEPPAFELPSNASAPKRKRSSDIVNEEIERITKENMDRIIAEATRKKLDFRAYLKAQEGGRGTAAVISSRREAKVSRQFQAYMRDGLKEEVRRLLRENLILKIKLNTRKKIKVEDTGVTAA